MRYFRGEKKILREGDEMKEINRSAFAGKPERSKTRELHIKSNTNRDGTAGDSFIQTKKNKAQERKLKQTRHFTRKITKRQKENYDRKNPT